MNHPVKDITIEQRGKILLEYRDVPSYNSQQVLNLSQEEMWLTLIIQALQGEIHYFNKKELVELQHKATSVP
ncbi:hypothetical protein J1N35_015128 [Gossypium stocksii]|uniref:Uncharacterized protein n=1 Tax=Gossypium stocksii TaxID=47602 RepID=A0A9D3VVU8_9ROSI|nr:hypothetical protein J1N35_015128 [Gossypium stocksii]